MSLYWLSTALSVVFKSVLRCLDIRVKEKKWDILLTNYIPFIRDFNSQTNTKWTVSVWRFYCAVLTVVDICLIFLRFAIRVVTNAWLLVINWHVVYIFIVTSPLPPIVTHAQRQYCFSFGYLARLLLWDVDVHVAIRRLPFTSSRMCVGCLK